MRPLILLLPAIIGTAAVADATPAVIAGGDSQAVTATDGTNAAVADQAGAGNAASIAQSGTGNAATVIQRGTGNRSVVRQAGPGGDMAREQEGAGRRASTTEVGGPAGRIVVRQSGN